MKWRITAAVLGALFYLLMVAAAVAGAPGFGEVLVTVTALVVLVGGGNWLQHWLGIRRKAPQFAHPERPATRAADDESSSP